MNLKRRKKGGIVQNFTQSENEQELNKGTFFLNMAIVDREWRIVVNVG